MICKELVDQIKSLQTDRVFNQAWWDHCDQHLGGTKDPLKHEAAVLENFLANYHASPSLRTALSYSDMVDQIKTLQRTDPGFRQAWWDHCDQHLGGTKDPLKHKAAVLENFLAKYNAIPSCFQTDVSFAGVVKTGQRLAPSRLGAGKGQLNGQRKPQARNVMPSQSSDAPIYPKKRKQLHESIGDVCVGIIKSYNETDGYGFIASAQIHARCGCEVVMQQEEFESSGCSVGDYVQFEVGLLPTGNPQALHLTSAATSTKNTILVSSLVTPSGIPRNPQGMPRYP